MPFDAPVTIATFPVSSLISILPWLRHQFDAYTSIEVTSRKFKPCSVISLDFGEALQVGAQDVAAQADVHELARADDLHQAGRFQLLDVMRDRRGAHIVGSVQLAAGERAVAGADLLEDLIAPWFGQRASDPRKLPIRQATEFG